ncbi:MAG: TIGR00645 family protein [Legionellaceae bacterium]|nr:TIGR00645 family protein [Legionellaceae bacterium]MBP9774192.1 TIGR00645 family protein [Legionellaceae bacterium]
MKKSVAFKQILGKVIFSSRWLQAPLYVGLIFALSAYVYRFLFELFHLFIDLNSSSDNSIMLGVLGLIDVVMIANLLIMVIMGGYETFIASLGIEKHPDQPEWLDHLDAGAMKIKLALALIGISSIHLLRTFIDPTKYSNSAISWQVGIHLTLLISALTIAFANRLLSKPH